MIIYNKTWLENSVAQDELKKAHHAGDITTEELKTLEAKYPVGFYSPNIFMRIGLFILTYIVLGFAGGLITLALLDSNVIGAPGFSLFLSLICYCALEFIVRNNHHFKSGVDDALMWTSAALFITAYLLFMDQSFNESANVEMVISGSMAILGAFFALRFLDMLMTAVSFLSLLAFIFFTWNSFGYYNFELIPFIILLTSAAVYLLSVYALKRAKYYKNCLMVLQIISLITAYLSCNYFVVREIGAMISEAGDLEPNRKIPLGWFFWLWTVAVPFVYIGLGILKKEVILLRSGLILVAAAAFTFRSYYHVMPIEATLCIIGALLLGIAYGIMKYLKTPKHGFTAEELNEEHLMDKIKVESLIVAETFSGPQAAPEDNRFGNGNFGGGGASGDF